jgi:hypothetical protein
MLTARRASLWSSRYEVRDGERPVTTWDARVWRSGGDFTLDGRRYAVRGNAWGNRYTLTDDSGTLVAAADRVGRKHWTIEAGRQTYRFQRASFFSGEQELHNAAGRIGSVRRTTAWRGDVAVDLPGMPLPLQIFAMGVVISLWDAQAAAAAS